MAHEVMADGVLTHPLAKWSHPLDG
jgi:hypothetical protein